MFRALVVGDSFMNTQVVVEIVQKVLNKRGINIDIRGVEWEFKGYQRGRLMGIKRELREFAGDPHKLEPLVKDVDVLLVHVAPVTEGVLKAGGSLKVVGCARGAPINVDVDAATMFGIPVIYTPGRNAEAVADHTLGLILAQARNIVKAHTSLKNGIWSDELYDYRFCGSELSGKTLGLIGLGRVGSEVAKRAQAFKVRVISYDPYVNEEYMKSVGVEKVDLETLLKESDFISIHARLTPETRHMIGEKELKLMKPTAILINTARGEIVDERSLIKALEEGWIAGAALDVFESEPIPPEHPLLRIDNVIVNPHISGASRETVHRSAEMLAEDVANVLSGKRPRYCANPEVFLSTNQTFKRVPAQT
ncbi:MAG: 2-hydroxyacid dehydrogenase [Nitrososphaerota archaeon]